MSLGESKMQAVTQPQIIGLNEVGITPAQYVTIKQAALITGLSEKAIRRKIEDGVWLKGQLFMKGPDGRIYIDMKGYTKWVQGELIFGKSQYGSHSRTKVNNSAARFT
jgi:hypothetical protein